MSNRQKMADIIQDIQSGIPIIVVDDYDRENEGDLVLAASEATRDNLVFMMNHARGLMCCPCAPEILDRLDIPLMVTNSTDPLETPFTVSVDAITTGTGMSVIDRLKTIAVLLSPTSKSSDLKRPGHLFPLRAREALLQERRGHTECSLELMRLAEVPEISVISEIMNDDGTMTSGERLEQFASVHRLKIISVQEVYDAVHNSDL
jgi:3,4-dihydroxy 2-butanone 4-phosphate synthase / GTP cyclohydrolase II